MMERVEDLMPLVASGWRNVPVLVVGDVMLDQYVWGEVERISPEAPVPVVRETFRDERPGGAANVAMNLAGLGASVTLVGFAGEDREQAALAALTKARGIVSKLTLTNHARTNTKLRVLSGHQQMIRLDMEGGGTFSPADYDRLVHDACAGLDDCTAVVLSDYSKGTLSEQVCQTLITEARLRRLPVLVDPKSRDFTRYRGASAVCPNRKELALATGQSGEDLEALFSAAERLAAELEVPALAVTLGAKGITLLDGSSRTHSPAVVREVFDVSGAGDTVIAVLALALACYVPLAVAIQLANVAAGIVIGKVGTVPITKEDLWGALVQSVPMEHETKILQLDQLLARAASWRSKGKRIVFTNGCFDLLHAGHIRLLEEARRFGDRLVVALNSDESVRKLKHPPRPIVGQQERAVVLAALSAVDAVVVFSEETPLRAIAAIRPDVLVKGGDYTEENVVGATEVRSWGGRVEIVPLQEGVSTSRLIAAVNAQNVRDEALVL